MIYIDELRAQPNMPANGFRGVTKTAHLGTDGDLEELHTFAKRIGLRRSWFQDKPRFPHYDVFGRVYETAIRCGATQVTSREWIKLCKRGK